MGHPFRSALCLVLLALPARSLHAAGGIAIVGTDLVDDSDHDGFADTAETVELRLLIENTTSTATAPAAWAAPASIPGNSPAGIPTLPPVTGFPERIRPLALRCGRNKILGRTRPPHAP